MTVGSVSEFERDGDTLAPPPDTSPNNEVPGFMGQAPSNIPSAPPYMQELFQKLDNLTALVLRVEANQESARREFRIQNEARKAEIRELDDEQKRHGTELEEVRGRLGRAESDLKDARRRIEELEREALARIDDGR